MYSQNSGDAHTMLLNQLLLMGKVTPCTSNVMSHEKVLYEVLVD